MGHLCEKLKNGMYVHQIQQVIDDAPDEHTDDNSTDISLASCETGSSDNHSGNTVICQVFTIGWRADTQSSRQENSGDAGTDRAKNVRCNLPFRHIDSGKLDSFISADGVNNPAEGSFLH